MRTSLLVICLTGAIGASAANAQTQSVSLRMKNSFADPVTIYVTDHVNGNKTDENNREITKGGESTSKATLDSKGYVDITFSVKGKADGTQSGYYCQHVTTSAKDKKELRFDLSKSTMKSGRYC